jgi:hypothetical protein
LKIDFGGEEILPEEIQAQLELAKETITYKRKKRKKISIIRYDRHYPLTWNARKKS